MGTNTLPMTMHGIRNSGFGTPPLRAVSCSHINVPSSPSRHGILTVVYIFVMSGAPSDVDVTNPTPGPKYACHSSVLDRSHKQNATHQSRDTRSPPIRLREQGRERREQQVQESVYPNAYMRSIIK